MKITDSDIIKNGEQELIDAITADLDWGAIEEIFLKEHNLGIEEDIEYKSGDIVAFDNQIAYKLEFGVKVNLSVLLNRDGEYLRVTVSNKKDKLEEDVYIKDHEKSLANETDAVVDIDVEEPLLTDESDESTTGQKDASSGDTVEDLDNQTTETSGEEPFGNFSDDDSDDMGQKVDNILENIKNTG